MQQETTFLDYLELDGKRALGAVALTILSVITLGGGVFYFTETNGSSMIASSIIVPIAAIFFITTYLKYKSKKNKREL